MVRRIIGSIPYGGPLELLFVSASAVTCVPKTTVCTILSVG